jgi:D-psicose/D-tagatose/L-ribulose 3-epimerase
MKLSLSNLAWDTPDNDQILSILNANNVSNIEGVLSKIDDWDKLTNDVLLEYKKKLNFYNIKMESIQSIFYNVKCDGINDTEIVYKHIDRLIEICKILGVKVMVFGSPTMRKGIIDDSLSNIFKRIDESLNNTNITLVIEPNSKVYNGDYFHNIKEIVDFIENNKFINIKTMIDTHNLELEGYDPIIELKKYYDYISHIHISEVKLIPITNPEKHIKLSNELKKIGYDKIITYEVLKCDNIESEINKFVEIYN